MGFLRAPGACCDFLRKEAEKDHEPGMVLSRSCSNSRQAGGTLTNPLG
jgi:hypothetical protein